MTRPGLLDREQVEALALSALVPMMAFPQPIAYGPKGQEVRCPEDLEDLRKHLQGERPLFISFTSTSEDHPGVVFVHGGSSLRLKAEQSGWPGRDYFGFLLVRVEDGYLPTLCRAWFENRDFGGGTYAITRGYIPKAIRNASAKLIASVRVRESRELGGSSGSSRGRVV